MRFACDCAAMQNVVPTRPSAVAFAASHSLRVLAATQASATSIASSGITSRACSPPSPARSLFSERILLRRFLDAIEERLPELRERELRLDLRDVHRRDRLLH